VQRTEGQRNQLTSSMSGRRGRAGCALRFRWSHRDAHGMV
jgi:hypothetical protein